MNFFPLVRVKLSNEHIMAALFAVVLLYNIPLWAGSPEKILSFAVVLIFGLLIDAIINSLRFRQPTCSVSAAVTVGLLQAVTPQVPLWGEIIGVAAALLIGKHIWGGTGKNPINPAITGLLAVSLLFQLQAPLFIASYLLIPAVILSIPFLVFRPYAAVGYAAGMLAALVLNGKLTAASIIGYGVIFFSCLVITDPVTSTEHPATGAAAGLLAGFIPMYLSGSVISITAGILSFNIISFIYSQYSTGVHKYFRILHVIKRTIPFSKDSTEVCDLTQEEKYETCELSDLSKQDILQKIRYSRVFGCGGAAFPAADKITSVMETSVSEKHFIINAVECDPGLVHDKWLLSTHSDEVYRGIRLIAKLLCFKSVSLAVKEPSGLKFPQNLKIVKVPDFYPAGAERILIKEVLHRYIPQDIIPSKEGILVLNLQTVYAIYESVYKNRTADSKYLTIADIRAKKAKVVRAKLGSGIHDIVDMIYPNSRMVFIGGGIMQARTASEEDTLTETVNFIGVGDLPKYKESHFCSKCGFCSENCPSGLKVRSIADLVDKGKLAETARYHAENCICCGSCGYVCLAGRNLSARVKKARDYLKNTSK